MGAIPAETRLNLSSVVLFFCFYFFLEVGVGLVNSGSVNVGVELYAEHLTEKLSRFESILAETGYSDLVIAAGESVFHFQDDMNYPFKANPYFKEWVPLNARASSFLHLRGDGGKPRLYLCVAEDIWHTPRQELPSGFDGCLDVVEYSSLEEISGEFSLGGYTAYVGEANTFGMPPEAFNPLKLITAIDFQRRYKTRYEQQCVREANRLAAPAHRAAHAAFMAGGSEQEICATYLRACGCMENDMPYSVIAGVNEHAAVLHHFRLDNRAPEVPRSFLIDAGVDVYGYASDITRTYAFDSGSEFAAMIQRLDAEQLGFVAAGAIGKNPLDLHILSHQKVTEILVEFGVITSSVEEAMALKLSGTFYPHGLGHHLGSNVHDKGSQLATPQGQMFEPPAEYPTMRHTAPMVGKQIYTVEPGFYFIPALLDKLRGGENADKLNWSRVEEFIPFGGIRIEDNIVLHEDGRLENLTRDAFLAC